MNCLLKAGWAVAGLGLMGGIASDAKAQITPSGGGYLFHQKFVKGKKIVYDMTVSSNVGGLPQGMQSSGNNQIKSSITREVLSVQGKVATVRISSGAMIMNGKSMNPGQSSIIKVDDTGKVIGDSGTAGQGQFNAPNRPIKVGETFKNVTSTNTPMGPIKVNVSYTFLGLKTVNGKQAAQIAVTSTAAGKMKMTANGTLLLDLGDGQPLRSVTTSNVEVQQGAQSFKIKQVITLTRK